MRGKDLKNRIKEIEKGKYKKEMQQLMAAKKKDLIDKYNTRDIEPDYKNVEAD